jgi:hypothetical protein
MQTIVPNELPISESITERSYEYTATRDNRIAILATIQSISANNGIPPLSATIEDGVFKKRESGQNA